LTTLLLFLCTLLLGPANAAAQTLGGKVVSGPKKLANQRSRGQLMAAGTAYGATGLGATASASDGSFSFSELHQLFGPVHETVGNMHALVEEVHTTFAERARISGQVLRCFAFRALSIWPCFSVVLISYGRRFRIAV